MNTCVVIVVNWNGWNYTKKCVESILMYNDDVADVIIVDNASEKDDLAEISKYCQENKICVIFSHINLGFGLGNNLGMDKALLDGYDSIWLLNNDTVINEDTLPEMLKTLWEDDNIGAVGSVILNEDDGNIQAYGGGVVNFYSGMTKHLFEDGEMSYIMGASMLIKAKVVSKLGGFSNDYFFTWEDVDLSFRIVRAGYDLKVSHGSFLRHMESSSTASDSPLRLYNYYKGLAVFMRKYSSIPLFPILVSAFFKITKLTVRGKFGLAFYVFSGTLNGILRRLS